MRYLIFILPLNFLACSQTLETKQHPHLVFVIDTVSVDAGDDFLSLQQGANALSPDGLYLYHFDRHNHSLSKIDLQQSRLLSKTPFEKEGPDGTGDFIYNIQFLGEEQFFLNSSSVTGLFRPDGTRAGYFDLRRNDLQGEVLSDSERLISHMMIPHQPEVVFALVANEEDNTFSLRKIDFEQGRISRYDIDPERKFPEYAFHAPSISRNPIVGPDVSLAVENGILFISSNLTNRVVLYDPEGDSLIFKSNHHQLVDKEKTGTYPQEYASFEELMRSYQKVVEEINFMPPIWDKKKGCYYRFSYLVEFEKEKAAQAPMPEISRINLFVSVLDESFKLLTEAPLPLPLKMVPRAFVQSGKIWLMQEMEEQPAFIRIEPDME